MRSVLFAGATRPDLVAKIGRSGPDAAIVDLEDAVPDDSKEEARAALPELIASVADVPRRFVRVNAPRSEWFRDDVDAVAQIAGVAGVVVPKAEEVADLVWARDALPDGSQIFAGLESARGVAECERLLAEAAPEVAYFGAEDYVADLGGRRSAGGEEVLYARSRVALAARLAGVAAIDQVVVDFRDDAAFERDAALGRDLGYRGKLCIHPAQVPLANAAFGASEEEVARARELLAAWEAGAARGIAAVEFEGAMVDGPALRMARETIERGGGS
ncbi:MAG TPA: CoA ester lyase [Solirubrobacterales bacterium]|nr:CoA ester lyase [Solirubrobacterales bacterium]